MFNENVDITKAQAAYARDGWVTINDVLQQDAAEEIWQALKSNVPWDLFYTRAKDEATNLQGPPDLITVSHEQLAALAPGQQERITGEINLRASKWYAFKYFMHGLDETDIPVLKEFFEALGSEKYYGLIRYISSELKINSRSAIATCYKPSCFLKQHDDTGIGRRVAHIFGFTKEWQVHWGGMLHMLGDDGDIERIFKPAFNSLMLFKVPKQHFVSQVAAFAPAGGRYSVTGWFTEKAVAG